MWKNLKVKKYMRDIKKEEKREKREKREKENFFFEKMGRKGRVEC